MNIFTARKYEEKVKSVITVSKIYSVIDICEITNIDEDDVIIILEKLIKKGKNNWEYRQFKNAHINYQTREIILDENQNNTIVDKFSKMTGSILEKMTPKEEVKKEDWKCAYCGGMNKAEVYECTRCNAAKTN